MSEIWNKELIQETVGDDDEMMQELIELFFEDGDGRIARLEDAVAKVDLTTVHAEAHAIKGAAGSFGAEILYEHCGELERRAHAGDPDLAALLAEVSRQYSELRAVVIPG